MPSHRGSRGASSISSSRGSGRVSGARVAGMRARWWAQAATFGAVGIANTAVDAAVFALLVRSLGWSTGALATAASAVGFTVGSVHSYLWNSRVTFGLGGRPDSARIASQFGAVTLGGLALTSVVFAAVEAVGAPYGLIMAKAAAVIAGAAWNFWLLRRWVFPAP